jgi:hypothetical protein
VVYEIDSSEVSFDAADREIQLISLGPIAEIRGGSPSMRALAAGVCADRVASTFSYALFCVLLSRAKVRSDWIALDKRTGTS